MRLSLLTVLVATLVVTIASGSQPTREQFEAYTELEQALVNNSFNLYTLAETFCPSIGHTPICIPVKYNLYCDQEVCDTCINCTQPEGYNISFLWTQYDMTAPIGPLLLSYASSGIGVRGFDWEEDCLFQQGIVLELNVSFLNYSNTSLINMSLINTSPINTSLINDSLHKMTARVMCVCVVCVCACVCVRACACMRVCVRVCVWVYSVYMLLHTRQ